MTDSRDVSRYFADLVVDTTYEGLGPAAAEAAKKSVLDTVGVALAASGMEPAVPCGARRHRGGGWP